MTEEKDKEKDEGREAEGIKNRWRERKEEQGGKWRRREGTNIKKKRIGHVEESLEGSK